MSVNLDRVPDMFAPSREIYLRDHGVMAALGMGGAMIFLWATGNPHIWTGAVAGLAAIAFRGWFMASEELTRVWMLDETGLKGGPVDLPLGRIETARPILSAVQVITKGGDKYLIKYLNDPAGVANQIKAWLP